MQMSSLGTLIFHPSYPDFKWRSAPILKGGGRVPFPLRTPGEPARLCSLTAAASTA